MESSVSSFLKDLGLERYYSRFDSQGYDSLKDLFSIEENDLIRNLCILDVDDKTAILKAVDELPAKLWLKEHNLQTYEKAFENEGIKSIKNVKELDLSEDVFDRLGILVPGHRKRLTLAVQSLSNTVRHEISPSDAVASGCWKRPRCDQFGKLQNLFLCVMGCFQSSKDVNKQSEELEFVVDSASDVVTARKTIIDQLGLEYIEHVESYGIHATVKMPIYKGCLRLGDSDWINVEVMAGEYESVGATVMREFHHIINKEQHHWISSS